MSKMELAGKKYSFNSLLSLAGYLKAKAQGKSFKNPIILASGL